MGNGPDLTLILAFLVSFLAAFAAMMVYSLVIPGGALSQEQIGQQEQELIPEETQQPPQQEVNISAERSEWKAEDLQRTQQYWGNRTPISIGGMVRTGDLLSVVFVNRLEQNVTLDTLNISGNVGQISLHLGGQQDKFQTRSFQSEEPCESGDFRLYSIWYNYSTENEYGEVSGELPYIVRCE